MYLKVKSTKDKYFEFDEQFAYILKLMQKNVSFGLMPSFVFLAILTLDWDRRGSLKMLRWFVVVVYKLTGGGGGGGSVSKLTAKINKNFAHLDQIKALVVKNEFKRW